MEDPPILTPIRHARCDVHKDLEPDSAYHFRCLTEIAALACIRSSEKVFDQAQTDVESHFVELSIDGIVVGFVGGVGEGQVTAELGDDGAVGEGYDFGVDFVYAGSELC